MTDLFESQKTPKIIMNAANLSIRVPHRPMTSSSLIKILWTDMSRSKPVLTPFTKERMNRRRMIRGSKKASKRMWVIEWATMRRQTWMVCYSRLSSRTAVSVARIRLQTLKIWAISSFLTAKMSKRKVAPSPCLLKKFKSWKMAIPRSSPQKGRVLSSNSR